MTKGTAAASDSEDIAKKALTSLIGGYKPKRGDGRSAGPITAPIWSHLQSCLGATVNESLFAVSAEGEFDLLDEPIDMIRDETVMSSFRKAMLGKSFKLSHVLPTKEQFDTGQKTSALFDVQLLDKHTVERSTGKAEEAKSYAAAVSS